MFKNTDCFIFISIANEQQTTKMTVLWHTRVAVNQFLQEVFEFDPLNTVRQIGL
jgi:hypothetical protein